MSRYERKRLSSALRRELLADCEGPARQREEFFRGVFFITPSCAGQRRMPRDSSGTRTHTKRSAIDGGTDGGTDIGTAFATTGHILKQGKRKRKEEEGGGELQQGRGCEVGLEDPKAVKETAVKARA
jgi:hypothetical protein